VAKSITPSLPKVPPRTFGHMGSTYVPPRPVYVRNTGLKHIPSLTTAAQPPAPPVVILPPPTTIAPKASTMTAPKVQIPAKPASKRKLKDEDYSTPYQPAAATLVEVPVADNSPSATVAWLDSIVIEDGIPVPSKGKAPGISITALASLLDHFAVKQSAALPLSMKHMLAKATTQMHQQTPRRYTTRIDKAAQTIRVWRIE